MIGAIRSVRRAGPAQVQRFRLQLLKMLVVADQHDAVARGDAQDREEANQRTEREDPAVKIGGHHTAHQSQGQAQEGHGGHAQVAQGYQQEEEDHDTCEDPGDQDLSLEAACRSSYSPSSSA